MKERIETFVPIIIAVVLLVSSISNAHSGGTDSRGRPPCQKNW